MSLLTVPEGQYCHLASSPSLFLLFSHQSLARTVRMGNLTKYRNGQSIEMSARNTPELPEQSSEGECPSAAQSTTGNSAEGLPLAVKLKLEERCLWGASKVRVEFKHCAWVSLAGGQALPPLAAPGCRGMGCEADRSAGTAELSLAPCMAPVYHLTGGGPRRSVLRPRPRHRGGLASKATCPVTCIT